MLMAVGTSDAQQSSCVIPVYVFLPELLSVGRVGPMRYVSTDGSWRSGIIKGLSASDFVANDQKGPIRVEAATLDDGPRRIVFVADDGRAMTLPARRDEAALILRILGVARSEDTFGLLTAGGPPISLPLGSTQEALRAAAGQLAQGAVGAGKSSSVLNSVLEAAHWLQPHQSGDAIFVTAMEVGGSHATRSKVQLALSDRAIRLFGFEFGPPGPTGQLPPEYSCSDPEMPFGCSDTIVRGTREGMLLRFGQASGGAALVGTAKLGLNLPTLESVAAGMYDQITHFYLLRLNRTGNQLDVALASSAPRGALRYPYTQSACRAQ